VANRLLRRCGTTRRCARKATSRWEWRGTRWRCLAVDEHGLDDVDRNLLLAIIQKYSGGPVGLSTIAASLSEEEDAIEEILRAVPDAGWAPWSDAAGRVATALAYKHFGMWSPTAVGSFWLIVGSSALSVLSRSRMERFREPFCSGITAAAVALECRVGKQARGTGAAEREGDICCCFSLERITVAGVPGNSFAFFNCSHMLRDQLSRKTHTRNCPEEQEMDTPRTTCPTQASASELSCLALLLGKLERSLSLRCLLGWRPWSGRQVDSFSDHGLSFAGVQHGRSRGEYCARD